MPSTALGHGRPFTALLSGVPSSPCDLKGTDFWLWLWGGKAAPGAGHIQTLDMPFPASPGALNALKHPELAPPPSHPHSDHPGQ